MSVLIGSARIDENGKAQGGTPGDQTGKEVATQGWYLHGKGWVLLRPWEEYREKIALAMERACANPHIGYCQSHRGTLYAAAKAVGFDPGKVTTDVETDCSALVRVCLAYGGITVGDFNTSAEAEMLMATGKFTAYTASKYTESSDYLKRGDVLVTKTKGHTVVVLSDGQQSEEEIDMTKTEVQELIDQQVTAKLATLTDVAGTGDNPSSWAKAATEWAKAQGIFAGDGSGNFGWQQPVTREQLAVVLKAME